MNGNLVLGTFFSVGKVEGTGAQARIKQVRPHAAGRARRRHRGVALPDPGAALDGRRTGTKKSARRAQLEAAALYPLDWLEERSGLVGGVKYFLFRNVPRDISWMQTLGSATLTAFLVQAITGVILAMYYKPDPDSAYESIQHITNDLTLGWLVRGMHKWGASVFIILMFLHMARVVPVRRLQVPARAELDHRRAAARARHARGLHRLPAAVGPDGVLGDRRRHQPERDGAVRRAVPGAVPRRAGPRSGRTRCASSTRCTCS